MPCRDEMAEAEDREREFEELGNLRAWMCGLVTAIRGQKNGDKMLDKMLSEVDWKEAGTNRKEFEVWWEKHQKQDLERRAEEKREAKLEKVKQKALNKLTPTERAALRIQ